MDCHLEDKWIYDKRTRLCKESDEYNEEVNELNRMVSS
jgi:hypothetical protein